LSAEENIASSRPASQFEIDQALVDWNRTQVAFDSWKSIADLFAERVRLHPEKTAVIFRDRQLSYRELDEQTSRWAAFLRTLGVGPEIVVAICARRSLEMMLAMVAVLKAGGAYLPLDPAFPAERIAFMLKDSGASVILTQHHLKPRFEAQPATVLALDLDPIPTVTVDTVSYSGDRGRSLAYLMYTSGSSGTPKGVMVENRNVVNFFTGMDRVVGGEPGVWLAVTSISFDISVLELLWTLTRGFTVLVQSDEDKLLSAGEYSVPEQIRRHNVSHLQCTPSYARMLMRSLDALDAMKSLRKLLLGGETLPVSLANELSLNLTAEIHNMYGPTETTVWSTSYKLARHEASIPIGRPIANTTIFILDERLHPVTIGAMGELYIGGAGVTRGYWKRPELTAERFVANPFGEEPDDLLYRTGDFASYRPDGVIDFHGRADHQIKIRGFRVELGEIESVLGLHPSVQEVAVIARERKAGDPQLVAYVVLKPGRNSDAKDLQGHARQRLPEYMAPTAVAFLEALPTTPNGKIDRKSLPDPSLTTAAAQRSGTSASELEKEIAAVWQEVLGLETVGLHHNLFDLGATSLTVAEAAASLRYILKRNLRLTDLFAYPTISAFAAYLSHNDEPRGAAASGADRAAARRQAITTRVRAAAVRKISEP
jgi:amino acid adenylation domain-containing protein